ncbi:MAG: DUF1275 domain-containing protein, partial [Lachnospiraceae bacterium]|nr:DUF1275 domain-containing protein [Lachnospiraceae bacterium]
MRKNRQMSESFLLCGILALSGGFQDAYTYYTRDKVFSNAQTGNVVLMSQHIMSGEWKRGLYYLVPLLAFMGGIIIAEQIQAKYKESDRFHWRQLVVLLEIITLSVVGIIPYKYNMIATMLVSFSCSMQVQSFRKLNGYIYASTMCIGNLRSGTEALSVYIRERNREQIRKFAYYFSIIFLFAIGAGMGGILSLHFGIHTIWITNLFLFTVFLLMMRES